VLQRTISPIDGSVYAERELASAQTINATLDRARRAQRDWRRTPVAARAAILGRFCDAFERHQDTVAQELAWQMGRPVRYGPNEVRGTLERARHMIAIAGESLADIDVGQKEGFRRFLRREPLGVVFTVSFILNTVIDMVVGQRSSAKAELEGLDIPEMGALAYPDFVLKADALGME